MAFGKPLPFSLPALGGVTSADSVTDPFSVSCGPCFARHLPGVYLFWVSEKPALVCVCCQLTLLIQMSVQGNPELSLLFQNL